VEVEAEASDGTVRTRVWRSLDPFTEAALADRVWWQLRAWIEGDGDGIPGGVVRLRLGPSDLSGAGRQLGLWQENVEEVERALARAQALVGPDGVLQADPQGGRLPGERVAWRRWGEERATPERDPLAPWPGATPAPAPALVPPEPRPLDVEWDGGMPVRVRLGARWEPVLTWSGPWRLSGRWWMGEEPVDRYQLVTSAGAFLCLVRQGRAFLAGVYD
jgi:protein ImuB